MPFAPKGEVARWRIVLEVLRQTAPGDTITYAQIGQALGLDPEADRHAIQMAMRRAAHEFEHETIPVPNTGYRIAPRRTVAVPQEFAPLMNLLVDLSKRVAQLEQSAAGKEPRV